MKIAIDARLYGLSNTGIGRYIENLVQQLMVVDTCNSYTLIVPSSNVLDRLPKNWQIVEDATRHYTLKEQTSFLKTLHSIDADVFHFPHFNVPLAFNKPFVVTIHDLLWHEKKGMRVTTLSPIMYSLKYFGYRVVVNHAVTQAKHVLTPTNYVKDRVIKRFNIPRQKVHTTYESVEDTFLAKHTSNKTILKKYKLDQPFIIYTGSLYPHKNVISVVKSLSHTPEFSLAIVSSRNVFADNLFAQVKTLGLSQRVHLLGFVPDKDLIALYKQAECLVLPSESEGFGLTGLEAMAAGLPVICSPHAVLKEVYGDAALFTDMKNPQLISEAITSFDTKQKSTFVKRGQSQVKKYSWEKMARETLAVYESIT